MSFEYAVFAEYSFSTKEMQRGANIRVLNTEEVKSRGGITLDKESGTITLTTGTYHVTAVSIVTPFDAVADADDRVTLAERPFGGYCRLRYLDRPQRECPPIAIGTISNANMLPSMIDTFLHVEGKAEIVLEHQAGSDPTGLFLQVYTAGSSDHVFARVSIHRI